MISLEGVQAICGSRGEQIALIYPYLSDTMGDWSIDTPRRMAMFVAQAAHESGSFHYLEEIASGQAYENRVDLGNVEPGDGVKFKGRGIFQITGRSNYARCSTAIFASDTLLLEQPELLSEPRNAAKSAGWFWNWKNLSKPADAGDVLAVTKKINGGTNGLVERLRLYKRACTVLGLPL